jgi:hypothetical protein
MDNDDITDRAQQHHEAHMEIPDPTPFERIISWVKILFATKKAALFLWAMFFGVSGTAIVGQVTDTKPFKEAAIELGLIESPQIAQGATDNAMFDELLNIQADIKVGLTTITALQKQMREHTHEALYAPLSYDLPEHTHPPPDLAHEHTEYALKTHTHVSEVGEHTHPAPVFKMSDAVKDAISKEVGLSFIQEMEGHVDILH